MPTVTVKRKPQFNEIVFLAIETHETGHVGNRMRTESIVYENVLCSIDLKKQKEHLIELIKNITSVNNYIDGNGRNHLHLQYILPSC